ncbi:hypothetical protein CPAR01_09075 [Colletotrichum paranaense]|uniref:Uncharacterized protein n=1 Tax=Colletotrichum paranaense TaxID=1914294 RepID=A0ABQ9SFR9_9PEZI|nr:uncharacterized protein CPAR01_09075 [Colletotrichum paranaense]KAK1535533.1 hypothetical protein CPAR01_09075 [Colletotrichum paranaense]
MQPRSRLGAFRLPVKGMVGLSVPALSLGRTLLSEEEHARSQQPKNRRGAVDGRETLGDSERTDWRREAVAKKKGKRGGQRELELELHWLPPLPMLRSGFACWDPRHTCTEYRGPIHSSGEAAGPSACGFDDNISQHHRNSTANVEAPSWAGPQSNLFANAKLKRFRNGHSLQASGCVLEQSIVGLRVEELHSTGSLAEVSGSSSCTVFSIRPSCPSGLCFKESFASRCFGYPYGVRCTDPDTDTGPIDPSISIRVWHLAAEAPGLPRRHEARWGVDVDLCRFLSLVKFSEQIFHLWLDWVLLVQELMDIGRNQRESEVALPASYSVVGMTRIWRQLLHGPLQHCELFQRTEYISESLRTLEE